MSDVKTVFCGKAPQWLKNGFLNHGVTVTEVGLCKALDAPVAHHIDMMAWLSPSNEIIVAPESKFAADVILSSMISMTSMTATKSPRVLETTAHLSPTYPDDVLLNAAAVGQFLLCNEEYIAKEVKDSAKSAGLKIIHVNQGYANCSVCTVSCDKGNEAVLTEDSAIYNACIDNGISALLISKGYVELSGYDCGFIGGAGALIEDKVYFFGSLDCHPQAEEIRRFLSSFGKQAVSLSEHERLLDIGGIFIL